MSLYLLIVDVAVCGKVTPVILQGVVSPDEIVSPESAYMAAVLVAITDSLYRVTPLTVVDVIFE